ncbi:MAG: hypothetical protein KBC32_11380 [Candidatus Didemnitutus sp.]|nr:hypothetical protein [Candidatus Didemnitutus sp.]
MGDSPSVEQKLAFADAFLRLLANRAPDVAQPFIEVLVAVRERPTERKVDSVYHDLLEWSRGLAAPDRRELSGILQRTLGLPLDYFDKKRLERIAKIVGRGHLRSDDEWRFIEERIQELCERSDNDEEIVRLNRLLAAYEEKKKSA